MRPHDLALPLYLTSTPRALCGSALPGHKMFSTALSLLGFFAIPSAWNACPSSLKPTYYLCFISASSLKISPTPIMISYSVFSRRFYPILFLLLQLFCSMHSVSFLSLPDSLDCPLWKYRPLPPLVQSIFGILTSILHGSFTSSLNKRTWS